MMNRHKYAVRRCAVCPAEFTPTRPGQRACGFRCARSLAGRTMRAKGTPAALARQQERNREIRQASFNRQCAERFGTLTPRELELAGFFQSEGYRRGYAKGYHGAGRRLKKGAAA